MNSVKKTERVYTPAETVSALIDNLEKHGDHILYRYFTAPKTIADMSYKEFTEMVHTEAAGLEQAGLAGCKIAIIGDTSPFWVATHLAIVAGGGIAVPMDKELLIEEIEGLLELAGVEAVVYSRSFNNKFAHAVESHPTLRCFIPIDPTDLPYADSEKVIPYARLLEMGKESSTYTFPVTKDMDRVAEMLFTSGTTGTSKCVMLSEKNMISAVNAACATVNFSPNDTIVSVLPIHHTYELCCMLAAMNYGMTIGINDSLKHVLQNFKTFAPTGLVLVPLFVNTIYKRIFDEAEKSGRIKKLRFGLKLSRFLRRFGIDIRRKLFGDVLEAFGGRLEKIICGGAPLNPKMCDVFFEFGVQISEGYGITECSPLISVNPYYAPHAGSVGPTVPRCQVRIETDGEVLPPMENGEIVVKGDNVMLGYYLNRAATEEAFTTDGWFRTGDMGHMDADGYIYITGRFKSVIVLENGKNVFPEEIEEYLSNVEGVKESIVVGRKGESDDTVTLTAIIVPDIDCFAPEATDEEIYEILHNRILVMNKKLASFKHIRNIEIRRQEFEKTTSRKIRRHLIK